MLLASSKYGKSLLFTLFHSYMCLFLRIFYMQISHFFLYILISPLLLTSSRIFQKASFFFSPSFHFCRFSTLTHHLTPPFFLLKDNILYMKKILFLIKYTYYNLWIHLLLMLYLSHLEKEVMLCHYN